MVKEQVIKHLLNNDGELKEEETWYSLGIRCGVIPPDLGRSLVDQEYMISSITKKTNDIWRQYLKETAREEVPSVKHSAKILIFDIETAPSLAYAWGKWQQNLHDEMLVNDWFMFTWSAKWLFGDQVFNARLTGKEAIKQDDKRITEVIWKLLDKADIIIGHNIKKFDLKKLNARFLLHGLGIPSSYEIIDTLLHARKSFAVHSNKLDYLANILGVGSKVNHEGFSMWKKCYNGDEEALAKMSEYNDGDILINEEVYLKILPFIKPHPNLGLFVNDDIDRCPSCGSDKLHPTGDYYTTTNTYPEYKCKSCGSNSRGRKANKRNKGIMSSLPR